jgi:outer membrane lipoprotein-sorting protein
MRKSVLVILVIVLIGTLGLSGETLEQVLKKNYETRGGLAKLKAVKTTIAKGKANQGGMEFPMRMIYKKPNKMIMEAEFMGKKIIRAYNGKVAWWIMPMMGIEEPTEMPPDQAKEIVDQAELMEPLVDYKEGGHKLELLGKEDMEGTEVYKLKLTNKKSKKVFFFYLDVESGIELKTATYTKRGDSEVLVETLLGDYKEVDGMMLPFQLNIKTDQGSVTITIDSYKLNETVEDSAFDMPAKKQQ